MSVTMKDIARMASVSVATVSKIINNKDGFISEATKQKVNRIIKEYSYTPNPIARCLVTNKSKTIGMIVPDILNPYFPELIRGCDDFSQKKGYSILLCNSDDIAQKESFYFDFLAKKAVDGIILTQSAIVPDMKKIDRLNIPIVTIDRKIDSKACVGSIECDCTEAGYLVTNLLIQNGHRRIVFLCGSSKSCVAGRFYRGYVRAMESAGIEIDDELVCFGEFLHSFGYAQTKKLLQSHQFTAVCGMSDMLALGAIAALRENGLKVPDDCAVTGFGDIFISNLIDPPITTINPSKFDMGEYAASMLIDFIEGANIVSTNKIFQPKLMIRKTS